LLRAATTDCSADVSSSSAAARVGSSDGAARVILETVHLQEPLHLGDHRDDVIPLLDQKALGLGDLVAQ